MIAWPIWSDSTESDELRTEAELLTPTRALEVLPYLDPPPWWEVDGTRRQIVDGAHISGAMQRDAAAWRPTGRSR